MKAKTKRKIISVLAFMMGAWVARAEVSDADIAAIGIFLKKDFACASSNAMSKPASNSFLVSEGTDFDEVDANDVNVAKERYAARLLPGRYREICVVCDVHGYGLLVRHAYVGPQSSIYWADEFESLAHLTMHQDVNQLGATRLLELSEAEIREVFGKIGKGILPTDVNVTKHDREQHLAMMEVLPRVGRTRPNK